MSDAFGLAECVEQGKPGHRWPAGPFSIAAILRRPEQSAPVESSARGPGTGVLGWPMPVPTPVRCRGGFFGRVSTPSASLLVAVYQQRSDRQRNPVRVFRVIVTGGQIRVLSRADRNRPAAYTFSTSRKASMKPCAKAGIARLPVRRQYQDSGTPTTTCTSKNTATSTNSGVSPG